MYVQMSVCVHTCASKSLSLYVMFGPEKPQKVFYECETPIEQVYLGHMGEQDAQLEGYLLPAIPTAASAAAAEAGSLEVLTTDA